MATWKKVIVSGSVAELATVSASVGLIVGSNQQITTAQATTFLTGSFTGSFKGDGTNLTGVTATAIFPTTAKTDLASTDQFFINDGANKYVTYGDLLTDLAGTNLAVEGTDSLTLASQIVVTGISASFLGNLTGTASYATQALSSSFASTASYALNIPTTSSYALQALSASYASTASYVNTLNQNVIISGGLDISISPYTSNLQIAGNGFGQTYLSTNGAMVLNPGSGGVGMAGTNQYLTLNYINGQTDGTILTGSFSGSFKGDGTNILGVISSSYAVSASQATKAISASYVLQAVSASFATNAATASYVLQAVSASFATSAATASYVLNAISASYSATASNISPAIINNTNNYLLTATGNGNINGESNLTFDGTLLTVNGNTTITGDLTVAGTASFTNTDNLTIKDKFILINSGSTVLADSGWITQYNAAGSGSAFYLEATSTGTYGRFAVAYDVIGTSTALTPDEYVVTARVSASAAIPVNPTWGGSGNGSGNMFINSLNGDIYIYS